MSAILVRESTDRNGQVNKLACINFLLPNQKTRHINTHGVADRSHARSISVCNVLLTMRMCTVDRAHDRVHAHGHYKSPVADRAHTRYADGYEMATLNATKLLLLTNQPKLTLTVTLTLTNTVTVIFFYAHFVDNHKKFVSH